MQRKPRSLNKQKCLADFSATTHYFQYYSIILPESNYTRNFIILPQRQFITRTSFNLLEGNLFDENSFNPPQRQFILGNSNDPGNLFAEIPLTSLKAIKILN